MINRARAMVTGLAALAALVLVVAGLPVVLYRFGGSPLPGQIGGWHRIATVLASRDDGSLLAGVIRACSWLAWLLFTACVLTEAQAAIRGSRAPHLQLGGLQGTAAYLVALVALAFAAPSAVTLSASACHDHPAGLRRSSRFGQQARPVQRPRLGQPAGSVQRPRFAVVRLFGCARGAARRTGRVRRSGQQARRRPRRRLPVVTRGALPRRWRPVSRDRQPELWPRDG